MPDRVTLEQFHLAELSAMRAAATEEFRKHINLHKILMGTWDTARWYECGEVYQSRESEAICHKWAGHPGRHAKRRSTITNQKLEKRA